MNKARLEAFSDGVLAIIITIMVLELKVPHDPSWGALQQMWQTLLCYVLSFVFVGIYWGNHHHLVHLLKRVNGAVMWANLHLLFWLSLIPFVTGWMGENHFAPAPTFVYGFILFMSGFAYDCLVSTINKANAGEYQLDEGVRLQTRRKGNLSLLCYVLAMGFSFFYVSVSLALYVIVAVLWIVPDRRIEQAISKNKI